MILNETTGIILAGGRAERMGGQDKGLVKLCGLALIEHVLNRFKPQLARVLINANRHVEHYGAYGCEVFTDDIGDYWGPLAGVATAMRRVNTSYILTVPCDTPNLPRDLAARMVSELEKKGGVLCVAHADGRMQNTVALISCTLAKDLHQYLREGQRQVGQWLQRHQPVLVDFSDQPMAFANINTPADCRLLEQQLQC